MKLPPQLEQHHRNAGQGGQLQPGEQHIVITSKQVQEGQEDHVEWFIREAMEVDSLAIDDREGAQVMRPGIGKRKRLEARRSGSQRKVVALHGRESPNQDGADIDRDGDGPTQYSPAFRCRGQRSPVNEQSASADKAQHSKGLPTRQRDTRRIPEWRYLLNAESRHEHRAATRPAGRGTWRRTCAEVLT